MFTVHGATKRGGQERHPPSREARRLLKQRSQESLRSRQEAGIPWIDHSPTQEQQGMCLKLYTVMKCQSFINNDISSAYFGGLDIFHSYLLTPNVEQTTTQLPGSALT